MRPTYRLECMNCGENAIGDSAYSCGAAMTDHDLRCPGRRPNFAPEQMR